MVGKVSWLVMEVVMEMVMTGDGGDGDGGVSWLAMEVVMEMEMEMLLENIPSLLHYEQLEG